MYTFNNTEINNEKSSVFETKSLLYLIGKRKDSKEIEFITIDCFNDISGVNIKCDKIWDIQSKNEKSLNPKKIGKYLFTLFKNYKSSFPFKEFIFFSPKLSELYKKNIEINIYNIKNIKNDTLERLKGGLIAEINRTNKTNEKIIEADIDAFLNKVTFVEDVNQQSEYIKSITNFKKTNIKTDELYNSIFNELRDIQTGKKNSYIENKEISEIIEVLQFERHLYKKDIEQLIISRIIGVNVFSVLSIPLYFSPLLEGLDIESKRDVLQECNSNLSRTFFNKNSNITFWEISEKMITYISKNINDKLDVNVIYNKLFKNYEFRNSYFTEVTVKYLISIIIEGLG